MQVALNRLRYYIANPRVVHNRFHLRQDPQLSFYPIIGLKQTKTGVMTLNKPDNNNNVTIQSAEQWFRFLNSYHHDHTVENVWIQNKGPSFSGGADYQQLLQNPEYLDRLMRLSIMIGEFNKPIFAKIHGSARGIGAYILTMFSTPLGTDKSSLRLDETYKGFIPIFGGSHRLSRLPCNIGLYLALTGDRLDADQMTRIGFLKGKVRDQHSNNQIHRHLSNANLWHRYKFAPSSLTATEHRKQNIISYKRNYFEALLKQAQAQIFKSGQKINENLALNQYRIAQKDYYDTINPTNSFTVNNQTIPNYFTIRHDRAFSYLKDKGIVQEGITDYNLIARLPIPKLVKVFSRNSVKEVLEELSKDGSQWAKRTQEMIRRNDPLAVHLTFKLLKNAQNLSWVECLEQQYKVARRLLNISNINHITTLTNKTLTGLKNPYSGIALEQIPAQKIEQFFAPPKSDSQIFDHDTPNNSFLPTSDYWRQYSDSSRNYLNRTFFSDYYAKFGQSEIKKFLHVNRIDYRDASYSIPVFRKYLYKKVWYDRMIELEKQRIRGIFKSDVFYRTQKDKRKAYLQQKLKSPELPKLVSQHIKQYFEQKFKGRFDQLKKTSKVAGKQSRMQILRNYVKTLTQNIVMNGRQIEEKDREFNIRQEGIVRFDKKNTDVFQVQNQYEKSIPELNTLKNAYKNDHDFDGIKKIDPTKEKPQYMFCENQLDDEEYDILKKDAALRLNYNRTILPRYLAFKYKAIIEKAAKTSQQLAGLMGWQNTDIESMIINSPRTETTFKQFAEQTLKNAPNVEQKIKQMNQVYQTYEKIREQQFPKLFMPLNQKQKSVKNILFDDSVIPRPFRTIHLALYEEVIDFYSQKYAVNGQITNLKEDQNDHKSTIRNIVKDAIKGNFSKLLKNDVNYTFSYLVILHLKQILSQIQKNKFRSINETIQFISDKFSLDFKGFNENQFNGVFMQYLYSTLDLHEESKHKIIFPQTKLIQFLNCFKMNQRVKTLKFQNLMLLIAKDRKMIRDSVTGEVPLLGYMPEIASSILEKQYKENNTGLPRLTQINDKTKKQQFRALQHMQSLQTNSQFHKNQKQLIQSFPHYLRRFEAMLQKISSSTSFLPKSLYKYQGKQTYQLLKQLLKIQQSQQQWFNQKLKLSINSLLDYRFENEKNMSTMELMMFDQEFGELFSKDVIGLVIQYQCATEEFIAQRMAGDEKIHAETNESINSLYLDIKSQVKNPRALRMLNNLIMSYTMIRDRSFEFERTGYQTKTYIPATKQQLQDIAYQKDKLLNPRTTSRLTNQIFRYSDDENGVTDKNVKLARAALGKLDSDQRKQTHFISELKEIRNLLKEADLKSQLDNRISRMQALQE